MGVNYLAVTEGKEIIKEKESVLSSTNIVLRKYLQIQINSLLYYKFKKVRISDSCFIVSSNPKVINSRQ